MRFEQMVGDLGQCHVRRSTDQGENLRSMALNPSRTLISALHTRLTGARASPLADQIDRCRRRHTESDGSASTTHALIFHGPNNAQPEIRARGVWPLGLASITSPQDESQFALQGNPSLDSARSENALVS